MSQTRYLYFILGTSFFALLAQQSWVPGMFLDGLIYMTVGKNMATGPVFFPPSFSEGLLPKFYEHPPLFFIIQGAFFKLFGVSWTTGRVLSAIFALGTWGVISCFIAKHFKKIQWSLFFGLCFCLIPPLLKKGRFPNLDLPLTLFYTLSLLSFYKKRWMTSGTFFGLALLTKGPPALFIPLIMTLYLVYQRDLKALKSWRPWVGFLWGLGLFGLWPLYAYLANDFHEFLGWADRQIYGTIIRSRDQKELYFFEYVIYLLKQMAPWFMAACLVLYMSFKKKWKEREEHSFLILCAFWIIGVLFPLSLMKWKYSHYLLPLYPPIAILAGYALDQMRSIYKERVLTGVQYILPLAMMILLVFPLTTKVRRDKGFFYALPHLEKVLSDAEYGWMNVLDVYPQYNFISLVSLTSKGRPFRCGKEDFLNYLRGKESPNGLWEQRKKWLFFVPQGLWSEVKNEEGAQALKLVTMLSNDGIVILKN